MVFLSVLNGAVVLALAGVTAGLGLGTVNAVLLAMVPGYSINEVDAANDLAFFANAFDLGVVLGSFGFSFLAARSFSLFGCGRGPWCPGPALLPPAQPGRAGHRNWYPNETGSGVNLSLSAYCLVFQELIGVEAVVVPLALSSSSWVPCSSTLPLRITRITSAKRTVDRRWAMTKLVRP